MVLVWLHLDQNLIFSAYVMLALGVFAAEKY